MRVCPNCQQIYEDAETRFCLIDGQTLVERSNQTPPNAAQQTVVPFSASLALTFFAHHFLENVPHEKGTLSFCQPNIEVSSWQFVTYLPIIAFWYLRENNCIRFTPALKQGIFSNGMTLVIEANPAAQVNFPGLEHDFFEIIKNSPSGVTIKWVFWQFLGKYSSSPEKHLIKRLIAWMIQLGYGQRDISPKPFFRLLPLPLFDEFIPICQRMMAHEQAAQIIHNRWMKFQAEQPDVFYYLFDDVLRAALDRKRGNSFTYYSHAEGFRLGK